MGTEDEDNIIEQEVDEGGLPLTETGEIDEDKLYGAGAEQEQPEAKAEQSEGEAEQEEPKAEQEEAEPQGKDSVPLATFLELRNESRQTRAQLEQMKQVILAQNQQIQSRNAKPEEQEEPEPDYLEDPKAYIDKKFDNLHKLGEALQKTTSQQQQTAQQQQLIQQVVATANQYEQAFTKQNPDYEEALSHVRLAKAQELAAQGVPEQAIPQQVNISEIALAGRMLQQGKDPAAEMYRLAKAYGYTPKPPADDKKIQQQREDGKDKAASMGDGGSSGNENIDELMKKAGTDEFDEAFKEMFG